MELKVFKDTVSVWQQLADLTLELPVETEIMLPDYLPEIFKVIKSFVTPVILQKQVVAGKLTLEGYFRLTVFYQSDDGQSLCPLEQKLPFSKTAELKAPACGRYRVSVAGESEYLNVRAISGRRLDIKGAYAFHTLISGETEQEVISAMSGAGVQTKSCDLSFTRILADAEKQFTAEDTLTFDQPPAVILYTQVTGAVSEIKIVSGKAVIKGTLNLTVVYRAEPGSNLLRSTKELAFNQIMDVENLTEECECVARVLPGGCTVVAGENDQNTMASVSATLQLTAFRASTASAVCDAYSTVNEAETQSTTILTEQIEDHFYNTVTVTASGALPDAGSQILDCMASVLPPQTVLEDGKLVIRGRAIAHLICANSQGELECYDKPCEYQLPKKYEGGDEMATAEAVAVFESASAHKAGDEAACELTISVAGLVMRHFHTEVLESMTCDTPLEQPADDVALRIYYGRAGEELFAIAKHYHADPARIAADSGVQGPMLEQDTRLLIPCAE